MEKPLKVGFLGMGAVSTAFIRNLFEREEPVLLSAIDPMKDDPIYGPSRSNLRPIYSEYC